MAKPSTKNNISFSRRKLLKGMAAATLATTGGVAVVVATKDSAGADGLADLLQAHFLRMQPQEIDAALARIERQVKRQYHATIKCNHTPAGQNVTFGYAINLSKCKGTRQCVQACIRENNCDRQANLGNIRVLQLNHGDWRLEQADPYYSPENVPVPGKWYLPVQCQQCTNPACVQACPVGATWQEPDGIVVIDYNWCIGCRYCAVACPYAARRFNWQKPRIAAKDINPTTQYLSNRPRPVGVMEKCTFCLQRTRKGQQPACVEACPTGARIFGNLLDPQSEMLYILKNKPVFRLKEAMATQPKFWYFTDS